MGKSKNIDPRARIMEASDYFMRKESAPILFGPPADNVERFLKLK